MGGGGGGGRVLSAFVGYDQQPTFLPFVGVFNFLICFFLLGSSSLNLKTTWACGSVGKKYSTFGWHHVSMTIFLFLFVFESFWE